MKRKICVVTGTRAEYGLLRPIIESILKNPKLELQLIVTGMHLLNDFGLTKKEIEKDGFTIDSEVDIIEPGNDLASMAKSVGTGVYKITSELEKLKPDIIVVLGDRIEPLAATISASIMNIPIAHISGGQESGGIDNNIRNAITKLSHIHFVRTPQHAEKLKSMGEEKWRVHTTGSLCLDTLLKINEEHLDETAKKYSIDLNNPLILVVFHPDTLDIKGSIKQTENLCKALEKLDMQTFLIYPNADAGSKKILEIINKYSANPKIKLHKNLPQKEYHHIMKLSKLMIGNSSSGIIEAPAIGLPMINIGNRQKGRDKLKNVIDIKGETKTIVDVVKKLVNDEKYYKKFSKPEKIYGDGSAGEKIVKILSELEISEKLLYKK